MVRQFSQANSVSELAGRPFLETLVGDIRSLEREPMKTVGFSGTHFERLHLRCADDSRTSLVLKHVHPEQDATVWRTGNVAAREARLLAEPALDEVWDVFDAPYLAYAFEAGSSAVLMRDVSEHLLPDVREPIRADQEDTLIDHLARLHARFWDRDMRDVAWLASGDFVFGFLAQSEIEMEEAKGRKHPVMTAALEGWRVAHTMLPPSVSKLVATPPGDLARITDGLPRTLLHGDAKVANFAFLPDRGVSAFDWSMIAQGCSTIDVGWYIAVNASRLTRSKEALLGAYRSALEFNLGRILDDGQWRRMRRAAILGGAMALLWNKALNVKKDLPGAVAEWDWWVAELVGF